jgi:hypothetical protein
VNTYSWVISLISLVVGLSGGLLGAYMGMKIGLVKLEFHMDDARIQIEKAHGLLAVHGEDLRVHDYELDDVMRKLELPRKKRQNWRFES